MKWRLLIALLGVLPAPVLAAEAVPNLRVCGRPQSLEHEHGRTKSIPVPAAVRSIVRTSRYHWAILTLGGRTICDDLSDVGELHDVTLTPDRRFLTYTWYGYEVYGQHLVDRTGRGKIYEIGDKPMFSPSRRLFATLDQTESEFGMQSGLAMWRVTPATVVAVARLEDIPRMHDWRIDGWAGEACLRMSAIPHELIKGGDQDITKLPRTRYLAKPVRRAWQVLPVGGANRCPG